jgi:hypothetical protein
VQSLQTPSCWRCSSSSTVAYTRSIYDLHALWCTHSGCIICNTCAIQTTVDFEAQEDAFVAKLLVAEGANGVLVGQPILITVDEESDVAAFKDYELPAENKPAEEAAPAKEEKPAAEKETAKKVPEKKEEVVTQPKPAATRVEEPATEPAKPAPKKQQGTSYHKLIVCMLTYQY